MQIIILIILIAAVLTAAICFLFLPKKIVVQQKPVVEIQKNNYAQILFVGDVMFDRGIRYYTSQNGGNEFIFDKITPTLLNNDLVVANLEGPITNNKSVSAGTIAGTANNYFFTFDPNWAKTLFDENIKIVDLGNNHILNFGRDGLAQTKKYLDETNVGYFGAPDGQRSNIQNLDGIKIAFVSYNQFSGDLQAEQYATIDEIKKDKSLADIVVVYSHWGDEYSLDANESEKNIAHSFIDAGADLIIGSHPHVVEPLEIYNGKRIYYSLGNFIFDQYFSEDVRNGLGVVVKIDKATKQLDFLEKYFYLNANGQTILKDQILPKS